MARPTVALFDYGSGNVHSAAKALELAGADVRLTADRTEGAAADGLVVPGVGAFAACMGASPETIEQAAEIGIEHNLGLTCDPIKGLVQIPCIERNAMASVKAINAARMAKQGNGTHYVSLDTAVETMRRTGADMSDKYKETALGGLAVAYIEC